MLWKDLAKALLHPARMPVVPAFFFLLILLLSARYFWLQDEAMSHACALGAVSFQCSLRSSLGILMYTKALGILSIPVAGLALWIRRPVVMVPALALTLMALVFYNADYGAVAATIMVVAVARSPRCVSMSVKPQCEGASHSGKDLESSAMVAEPVVSDRSSR